MERQRRATSSSRDMQALGTRGGETPTQEPDLGRRRFLGAAVLAMTDPRAARIGGADAGAPHELASLPQATEWINSPHLTAATLVGKIILADFWTYTCINWLRTLPHVRAWARKYSGRLAVIGVHTPEFAFERNPQNVRRSVQQMKIDYPVAMDNDHSIWSAFSNNGWPDLYLIDARGQLRYHHFGEGEYQQSERAIQGLLAEAGLAKPGEGLVSVEGAGVEAAADLDSSRSTETYLGHDRTAGFASPGGAVPDRPRAYVAPRRLALNEWALAGDWTMGSQAVGLSGDRGRISYRFHARDVHLVIGPSRPGAAVPFRVSLDGRPPGAAHGVDVHSDGTGTIVEQRLYQLIRQSRPIVDRTFEIEFAHAGVDAFAFTFG